MVKTESLYRPQQPEALCGKRVGSIKGGAWIPRLRALSEHNCPTTGQGSIDIREFPTSPEVTQALFAGAIDVEYEDAAVAKAIVDKTQQRLSLSSTTPLYPVVVGLAVRQDNGTLHDQLIKALSEVTASGEYAALLTRYNVQQPDADDFDRALQGQL